ncbi:MAG: flavodoxin family protein, partial [Desulforhopalus sp.]
MNINKVWAVFFSPTRTTKKIVEAVLSGIAGNNVGTYDLTYSAEGIGREFHDDELVVFGVPVYAGRVAPLAVERLAGVRGNKSPAVLVVVYGNRDYEDALIELRDLAEKASFIPVAAAAFIGEHSFSSEDFPIAQGRPDSD